jgi:hypothetical protein
MVFTGNVTADFPASDPSVFVASDTYGTEGSFITRPSGWDVASVRFAYDQATDTGYFGACSRVLVRLRVFCQPVFMEGCVS